MYYAILIIIAVLCIIGAVTEASKRKKLEVRTKYYINELKDERCWSNTVLKERDEALTKCEQLADENASLAHDVAKLRKCTVDYALQNWYAVNTDIPGRVCYIEGDITLIYENGFISWCKTDSVPITFKNVPDTEVVE